MENKQRQPGNNPNQRGQKQSQQNPKQQRDKDNRRPEENRDLDKRRPGQQSENQRPRNQRKAVEGKASLKANVQSCSVVKSERGARFGGRPAYSIAKWNEQPFPTFSNHVHRSN